MLDRAHEPTTRQPALFIPHGGGPCFFMDDPRDVWTSLATFLRDLPRSLPATPSAILLVSGHWETDGFAFTGGGSPDLIYDYSNFPPHTYALTYPASGAPALAARAAALLDGAGLRAGVRLDRAFDHAMFVPLKVAFPHADVPVVEVSVDRSLDPALHLAAGRALAPLRDEGVLIVGSGMSFHNMRGYGDARFTAPSRAFDAWLADSAARPAEERAGRFARWAEAPGARIAHPEEEHLIPLMVAAGASNDPGEQIFSGSILETAISAFRFN